MCRATDQSNVKIAELDSFYPSFRFGAQLPIVLDLTPEEIDLLNADNSLRKETAAALKTVYKYEGAFNFEADIPF